MIRAPMTTIPIEYKNSSDKNSADQEMADKIKKDIESTKFHFDKSDDVEEVGGNKIIDILNLDPTRVKLICFSEKGIPHMVAIFINDVFYGIADLAYDTDNTNSNTGNSSNNGSSSNNNSTTPVIKSDTTTNIKLEAPTGVIPSNTVMEVQTVTTGNTFNQVKTVLTDVKNFKVFDITLKSNGAKIQPNGKLKISIPIPNEFDTSKLTVYRITDDNKKTEYNVKIVTENNIKYATFETDHFSTYVLAEAEKTSNNSTSGATNTDKKDDTPKTGANTAISNMLAAISMTSLVGIVIVKRKF